MVRVGLARHQSLVVAVAEPAAAVDAHVDRLASPRKIERATLVAAVLASATLWGSTAGVQRGPAFAPELDHAAPPGSDRQV